jgi:N-acetylmuramoyl-L-alanine amidase
MRNVIISCGHMWKDPGAVYKVDGAPDVREVDVNWKQSLATMLVLENKYEYCVDRLKFRPLFLTPYKYRELGSGAGKKDKIFHNAVRHTVESSKPESLSIGDRIKVSNDNEAVLVEIHNNIFHEDSAHGAEVIVFSKTDSKGKPSQSDVLGRSILLKLSDGLTSRNRGVKEIYDRKSNAFIVPEARRPAILYKTKQPSLIVEVGFISNSKYRESISNFEYHLSVGQAIAEGLMEGIESINNLGST